jgi:SsrA-binding protein
MKLIKKNKSAYFEYEIIETYISGIQLHGSEVKSILENKVNFDEAYCFVDNGEMFIKNMHVSEHKRGGTYYNHQPLRIRKLLLKKREILNIFEKSKQKGFTIVPLSILVSDTKFIKIEIGLVKGKKTFDKSKSLKEKDLKRESEKILVNVVKY